MTDNVPITLDDAALTTARRLAKEGVREPVIRQTLGLSTLRWKELKQEEDSPLQAALDVGVGEGAAEVIEFMRDKMREGSMRAAEWLGERVYRMHPTKPDADSGSGPKVLININAPLSPEEYKKVIHAEEV